jgi:hypothetical protein
MAQFLKPDNLNNVWASGGDRIYPGDTKYATGWQVEIPPRQYFNEIDYKQDQMLAHLNQHGIPKWDNSTEYQANQSYVQGVTGTVYRCVLTHVGQDPDLDVANTYWIIAFASAGDFYTASESDARYARLSLNGSDYNASTFRTNLSLYSKSETYTKVEVNNLTTVASTAQAQALSSNSVIVTPLRLAEAFKGANQSLIQSSGYQKFPGGLILQWGLTSTIGVDEAIPVTFPLAFPNACLNGSATTQRASAVSGGSASAHVANLSSTTMTVVNEVYGTTTSNTLWWFAIGY